MELNREELKEIRLKTISPFLREKRLQSNLSQAKVSEKLGYTDRQFVSQWERGISNPPTPMLPYVCELYGITEKELFDVFSQYQKLCLNRTLENLADQFKKTGSGFD